MITPTELDSSQAKKYMAITNYNGKIIFKVISQTNLASL